MSLFRTSRPPALLSDEAIERYIEAIRHELQPDPLYRRRLRGIVVNRYVAAREGAISSVKPTTAMSRLGRAALVASCTLGIGATSVMAASQEALPGELLYPLKQRVEQLRVEVLPAHLHDDLAAAALGERIDELAGLALRGDEDRVAALALVIQRDYEELAAAFPQGRAMERPLVVLDELVERLPEQARLVVADVLEDLAAGDGAEPAERRRNDDRGIGPVPAGAPASAAETVLDPTEPATPRPARSPRPMPSPSASPTPRQGAVPTDEPATAPATVESPEPASGPAEVESPEPATVFEPTPGPTPSQPEDGERAPQAVEAGD